VRTSTPDRPGKVTLGTYGHLMPGSEEEAAELVDAYLTAQQERAEELARGAGRELTGEPTGERERPGTAKPL
jgi:hypothetical protein